MLELILVIAEADLKDLQIAQKVSSLNFVVGPAQKKIGLMITL